MSRENGNEMEQIQKNLERFLDREVEKYEKGEAGYRDDVDMDEAEYEEESLYEDEAEYDEESEYGDEEEYDGSRNMRTKRNMKRSRNMTTRGSMTGNRNMRMSGKMMSRITTRSCMMRKRSLCMKRNGTAEGVRGIAGMMRLSVQ